MKKTENAIEVKGVSKKFKIPHRKDKTLRESFLNIFSGNTYTTFYALKDVSFNVKKGEFFGIIGRNGSGKSTLLKIISGIFTPDRGVVKINGKISPFLELGVGFNPELSGRENIFLNGAVLGMKQKEIKKKFDSIVAFTEKEKFIDQKLKNYSSGMQARLAFSIAIHANNDILIMDEVLAVGDLNFQRKCIEEFNKARKNGKTIILVTHDIGIVQRYCDKCILIKNGKIRKIGKTKDVLDEYLYENSVDLNNEHKKIQGQEKEHKKKPTRWGTHDVVITSLQILSSKKKEKSVFQPFEDIEIKINYQNKNKIEAAIFGFEIYNTKDTQIFGMHSGMIPQIITLKKEGIVTFKLHSPALVGGDYFINPAVADPTGTIQYDYWKKACSLSIIDNLYNQYLGQIKIKVDIIS